MLGIEEEENFERGKMLPIEMLKGKLRFL